MSRWEQVFILSKWCIVVNTFCPEQSLHHLHSFGRQGDGADVGQGPTQNVKGAQKTNCQTDKKWLMVLKKKTNGHADSKCQRWPKNKQ